VLVEGRCAKAPGYLCAHPLGQAEPEKDFAQALDSARAQPKVGLYVQDLPVCHRATICIVHIMSQVSQGGADGSSRTDA
jgi:hypothetical protein